MHPAFTCHTKWLDFNSLPELYLQETRQSSRQKQYDNLFGKWFKLPQLNFAENSQLCWVLCSLVTLHFTMLRWLERLETRCEESREEGNYFFQSFSTLKAYLVVRNETWRYYIGTGTELRNVPDCFIAEISSVLSELISQRQVLSQNALDHFPLVMIDS